MKHWLLLAILGLVPALPAAPAGAAARSDWPALNADAARSNYNPQEKTISVRNVLRLKVKWALPIPEQSYPIVSNGIVYLPTAVGTKIQAQLVNARTGKRARRIIPADVRGGMLATPTGAILAGKNLQTFDPVTGKKQSQLGAPPGSTGGLYLAPTSDGKVVLAGYATSTRSSTANLYTVDPTTGAIAHRLASTTAQGVIASRGRILTLTASGGVFYDELSGKSVGRTPAVFGPWFAGSTLAYTVATSTTRRLALMAFDGTGKRVWSRTLGPPYAVQDWPHAVTPNAVLVAREAPKAGIEALDPLTGAVLWNRSVPNVQRLADANGVLYALSYGLGQAIRIVALNDRTGAVIGAIALSPDYYAFTEQNDLMIASGMVFLRVMGPTNTEELVALGLPAGSGGR